MLKSVLRRIAIGCALVGALPVAAGAEGESGSQFPRVITGRVTDGDGAGVEGALVEWGFFDAAADERESVTTDADGRYRLETSTVGRDFRIGFSKAGFAPVIHDGIVPGAASKPTELDATLQPATTVAVQFTTETGEPVAELKVTLATASNGFHSSFSSPPPSTPLPGSPREYVTDADGRVTLTDLPAKPTEVRRWGEAFGGASYSWLRLNLTADSGGWYEQNITDEQVLGDQPVVIRLPDYQVPRAAEEQNGVVRGRVVDAATGEPITRFWTVLRYKAEANLVDDADGQFTLGASLRPGAEYEVRVFAPGYGVAAVKFTAENPDRAKPQAVELTPHSSFEGRLIDAVTGEPIANVQIVAGAAPSGRLKYIEWSSLARYADGHHTLTNVLRVTTDDDGRFTIPEAPGMPVTLVILAPGHGRRVVPPTHRAAPDDAGIVGVPLEPAASVTAVAVRETPIGVAARSASLSYRSDDGFDHMYHSLELDDDGRHTIDSLAPGDYRLTLYLEAGQYGFPSYSKGFTLEAGQKKTVLLGPMPGVLRLHGKAFPFAVIQVQPRFETEINNFAVQADVDGRFELSHLLPGEYEVTMDVSSAASGYHSDLPSVRITLETDMWLDLTHRLPNGRND